MTDDFKPRNFRSNKTVYPLFVVDCSAWKPIPYLRVDLHTESNVTSDQLDAISQAVTKSLQDAAPDLQLVHDRLLTLSSPGELSLAIVPQVVPSNVHDRLKALLELARGAANQPGVTDAVPGLVG